VRNVLVVEDAALMRALLRDILRREGYVVHEAVGVRDAVDRYREVRPDIVTLDLTLPDGSGIDCLARLRALDAAARVVIISAVSRTAAERESIDAGALAFVSKPFRPDDVTDAVRTALATSLRTPSEAGEDR
jgi:two-component system chemotaxis response regulator CheY